MASNPGKTEMINLAIAKLHGATDAATIWVPAIDDSVFATPSSYPSTSEAVETVRLACMQYPHCLKQALLDIQPKFAKRFADLGSEILITQSGALGIPFEMADWLYMFDVPSDYLALIAQINEGGKTIKSEMTEITAHSYAHIVKGTDDQAYYCILAHTAASGNKPITGASYATNWALFDTDGDYGADWESGHAYKSAQSGKLLLTNGYSNADGDSAYIEYLAYAAAGVSDIPTYYDQHFIEAFTTFLASAMAPWSTESGRRAALRAEYERLAKPQAIARQARPDYEKPVTTWLEARTK